VDDIELFGPSAMAGVDRLSELKMGLLADSDRDLEDQRPPPKSKKQSELEEIKEFMATIEPIKANFAAIESNIASISGIAKDLENCTTKEQRDALTKKFENLMETTTGFGTSCQKQLMAVNEANKEFSKNADFQAAAARSRLRSNIYTVHVRRLKQLMADYNTVVASFKAQLTARTKRELALVDPKLTSADIDAILETGEAQNVVQSALVSDDAQKVLRSLAGRRDDIKQIEKQVLEVYELFQNLQTLVDNQQESLDNIENHVHTTLAYAEKAEEELEQAVEAQNKTRKYKFMALCCCIVVIIGLVVVVLKYVLML